VNWVLDLDIRTFFDSVDHGWLVRMLRHRIADPRVLRLIERWLKAGILESGRWEPVEIGTPQGSGISPILANAYLEDEGGLDAAHACGLVHRDVSPHNILIGVGGEVKLSDFGIAKAMTQSLGTQAGMIRGKLAYASPEQLRSDPLDHQAPRRSTDGREPLLRRMRRRIRERRPRRFLHHIAELSGQHETTLAGHRRRLDEEDVAPHAGDGETGCYTGHCSARCGLLKELRPAERFQHSGRIDDHRLRLAAFRNARRRLAEHGAQLALELADAGLARVFDRHGLEQLVADLDLGAATGWGASRYAPERYGE